MTFTPKDWRDLPEESTPIDAAGLEDLETRLAAFATPIVVATLPSTPTDGDEVVFQNPAMAALGVAWHLRYRAGASGASKWEMIGGAPLYLFDNGPYSSTVANWVFAGSNQLVVPLAGDYEATFAGRLGANASSAVHDVWAGIAVNGAITRLQLAIFGTASISSTDRVSLSGGPCFQTLPANAVVRPMINTTGGNTVTFEQFDIGLRPIRVG